MKNQKIITGALAVLLLTLGLGTVTEGNIPAPSKDPAGDTTLTGAADSRYYMFKCPFFPDGYALPKDVLIKFFAMRTHYTFGKVRKLVFTMKSNRDLGDVNFRLYSGIPNNPTAVLINIPATAEVTAPWRSGGQIVFDALDTLIPPGYPQSFLLKAEPEGLPWHTNRPRCSYPPVSCV